MLPTQRRGWEARLMMQLWAEATKGVLLKMHKTQPRINNYHVSAEFFLHTGLFALHPAFNSLPLKEDKFISSLRKPSLQGQWEPSANLSANIPEAHGIQQIHTGKESSIPKFVFLEASSLFKKYLDSREQIHW